MKEIPKSFELGGHKFEVVVRDDLEADEGNLGTCEFSKLRITLQKPNAHVAKDVVLQTFWHEAVHAIFRYLWRGKLGDDERLVEQLGHAIHQIEKTVKF